MLKIRNIKCIFKEDFTMNFTRDFKYVTGIIDNKEFPFYNSTSEQIRLILDDASQKVSLETEDYDYYLIRFKDDFTMEDLVAYTEEEAIEKYYYRNSSDIAHLSIDKQRYVLINGYYKERIKKPCVCYSVVNDSQIYYCIRYYAD